MRDAGLPSPIDVLLAAPIQVTQPRQGRPAQHLHLTRPYLASRGAEAALLHAAAIVDWDLPIAAGRYVACLVEEDRPIACVAVAVVPIAEGQGVRVDVLLGTPRMLAGNAPSPYDALRRLVQVLPGALAERLHAPADRERVRLGWLMQLGPRGDTSEDRQVAEWLHPAIAAARGLLQLQIRAIERG